MDKYARISTILMTAAAVSTGMFVFVNARAGEGAGSAAVDVGCCLLQAPGPDGGYDQHWEFDSDNAIPTWSCYPGGPVNCVPGSKPPNWWPIKLGLPTSVALGNGIRQLESLTGDLKPQGPTLYPGFVVINSQLMLVYKGPAKEGHRGAGAAQITIDNLIDKMSLDPKSIVIPIRKGAPVGSGPQMCWGADSGGNLYQVPSKSNCVFPAQLLSCTRPSRSHDEKLMQVTSRANAILKKIADSNRDRNVRLAILMVRGRPALAWVRTERPKAALPIGPNSKWEEIQAALNIGG